MLDIIPFIHQSLREVIHEGDTAIDATAGNGFDTLYLAQCVGKTGKVFAFDIQQQALDKTFSLLQAHNVAEQVNLIHDTHDKMEKYVNHAQAIVFNLGYLPCGDKNICTQEDTTVKALQSAWRILNPQGVIALAVYSGHNAGKKEALAVENFARNIAQKNADILRYQFANRPDNAPYALIFHKK